MPVAKQVKQYRKPRRRFVKALLEIFALLVSLAVIVCALSVDSFLNRVNKYRRLERYLRANKLDTPDQICGKLTKYDAILRNSSNDDRIFWSDHVALTTKVQLSHAHEQSLYVDLYSRLSAEELTTRLIPEAIYIRIDAIPFALSLTRVQDLNQQAINHLEKLKLVLDNIQGDVRDTPRMIWRESEIIHEAFPGQFRGMLHEYQQSVDSCRSVLDFNRAQYHKVAIHLEVLASGGSNNADVNVFGKPLVAAWLKLGQDNMEQSHATIAWFHREMFRVANDKDYPHEMLTMWDTLPYLWPGFYRFISAIFGLPETEEYVFVYEAWH